MHVSFTERAVQDIENAAAYIAQDSQHYAELWVQKVIKRIQVLKQHPKIGKRVPELNDENIREVMLGRYRIIYTIIGELRIDILTIHHSARLLAEPLAGE